MKSFLPSDDDQAPGTPGGSRKLLAPVPTAGGRPPYILVVDDEPSVLLLLEIALRQYGFVVWSALGGEKAVRLFEQYRDDIDLVLLDVQMPGLDGVQTLGRLRALAPDVRCCLMSGSTGQYSQSELLDLGIIRVLEKPFGSIQQLASTLRCLASPLQQQELC